MKISIITPVYCGNKYLNSYLENIERACKKMNEVEVIFVNDSPNVKLKFNEKIVKSFSLKIIENSKNEGIHKSRCIGLENANGKYILFLDQDDEIMEDTLITQYNKIESGADMVLGNGLYEDGVRKNKIFDNKFSQKFATKKKPYILARNFIISPGQCLIKKETIPEYWKEHCLKANGADDYLLWLLMFNEKMNIIYNYNMVYIHKYTGENVSLDDEKMFNSQLEIVSALEKCTNYNEKDLKRIKRTIIYKHNYKKKFILETLKNLDIFIYNVWYRILWRGYIKGQ